MVSDDAVLVKKDWLSSRKDGFKEYKLGLFLFDWLICFCYVKGKEWFSLKKSGWGDDGRKESCFKIYFLLRCNWLNIVLVLDVHYDSIYVYIMKWLPQLS